MALRPDLKLRAVTRLLTTPRGRKTGVAQQLASECGRSVRAVFDWQRQFRRWGYAGLAHARADKGVPRVYSASEFERVIQAAGRIRWHGDIRREWRSLKLPGSYQQFRRWVRQLRAFGYVETESRMESRSA